jgi:glutamate carboxypeptidase
MSAINNFLVARRTQILADLEDFVTRESPSDDKPRLDAFAEFLRGYAERMSSGVATVLPQERQGNHVRLQVGGTNGTAPIFMVGHFDTVWPVGTLQQMPFRVEDGLVRGPGVFDMKAGLVQALWAMRAVRETGERLPPIIFLFNSDEEIGSPTSRPLIEEEARRAHVSLVLEPAFHGALKTARKGVGIFTVEVTGRAAHAGSEPWEGVSAIDEAARLTLQLHAASGGKDDPTVNVGVVQGGTRGNVVAASARMEVDLRVTTNADAERMCALVQGLKPHHPDAVVRVTGGMNRPPMERTERVVQLFRHARSLAAELGFQLEEAEVGGGSDGNFCAGVNAAVLDGLGAVGDGGHALTEHVQVEHIVPRAALVARLLQTISEV